MLKPFYTESYVNASGCTSMPALFSCPEMDTEIIMDITLVMSLFVIFLICLIISVFSVINLVIIICLDIIISLIICIFIRNHKKERLKVLCCI